MNCVRFVEPARLELLAEVCYYFNDFGENFSVLDKNGEELADIMIKSISLSDDGKVIVSVLDNYKHKFDFLELLCRSKKKFL